MMQLPSPRRPQPVEGIGRKIRELRKDRSLTQADLAGRIGIQQSDLCRMENGQYRISLETLVKLLAELEVPISEFLDEPAADLTPSESALVRDFRHLSADAQQQARHFVRFLRAEKSGRPSALLTSPPAGSETLESGN
ncbi:MAG: helix-turn-helix domain-containing protein [Acidobacteriota bacterium]